MSPEFAVRAGLATTILVLITGCATATDEDPESAEATPTTSAETNAADLLPAVRTGLGNFPAFPKAHLPDSIAASLQAVLDQAVADDIVRGTTAAVILAGSGSWAGATGVDRQGGTP